MSEPACTCRNVFGGAWIEGVGTQVVDADCYFHGWGAEPDPASAVVHAVQNSEGTWDALDGNGYGHSLGYPTIQEAEAWIRGYECGASENM